METVKIMFFQILENLPYESNFQANLKAPHVWCVGSGIIIWRMPEMRTYFLFAWDYIELCESHD